MNTKETIIAQIKEMSSEEIMGLNNLLCDNLNLGDDMLFFNDEEFFNMAFGTDLLRAVQATQFGEYSYNHDFVMFNGYGNLDSFQYLDHNNLFDILDNIADYIIEDFDTYAEFFNGIEIENN